MTSPLPNCPLFGITQRVQHHVRPLHVSNQAKATRNDEEAKIRDNERLMTLLGGRIPGNWLLTREEMLANPPKILLTNYAMLEHLLLLPRNAPLFKHSTLQTIVLDEIHTYSGAQATEVAFLLRKLKTRLGIDNPNPSFWNQCEFERQARG